MTDKKEIATINISKKTNERLKKLKHRFELNSADALINQLMDIVD